MIIISTFKFPTYSIPRPSLHAPQSLPTFLLYPPNIHHINPLNPQSFQVPLSQSRSKINTLPNYQKSDLSLKLPSVIVFQTIQISRLSQQIQVLRITLKDLQKQLCNYHSYQIQIRQLTDQCHQYNLQQIYYKQQLYKLNNILQQLNIQLEQTKIKYQYYDPSIYHKFNAKIQQCQHLVQEINKWKDKYKALQNSKDKELQDLKQSIQSQRKSSLNRQLAQLTTKFTTDIANLQSQLKKQQQQINDKNTQLIKIQHQNQQLKINNSTFISTQQKIKQSQFKFNKISQQLVRFNQLLRNKHQQIQSKNITEHCLKQTIKKLQNYKSNHEQQLNKIPQLEKTIKEWAIRCSKLQNQNNCNQQRLQQLPILQTNINNYTIQIQRLSQIIKAKIQQITDTNLKIQQYQSLYTQQKQSQSKIPILQNKISQLNSEIQRLNNIFKNRLIEIQQNKNKFNTLQKTIKTFQQAQPQKTKIKQQHQQQLNQIQKCYKHITDLQTQLSKIIQLQTLLHNQQQTLEQYTTQINNLNQVILSKSSQIQTLHQKLAYLEKQLSDFSNFQSQLNNYQNQYNRLVSEIDNINGKINQKCIQLQNLSQSIATLSTNFQPYKQLQQNFITNINQTQNLIQQLKNSKIQLQNTEQKLIDCQSQLNIAKNNIISINNDRQIINRNLNIKTQQLQQANGEIRSHLQQIKSLKLVQQSNNTLKQQLQTSSKKLKQAQQSLKTHRQKSNEHQHKSNLLSLELQKIHRNGFYPQSFKTLYNQIKTNCQQHQKYLNILIQNQQNIENNINDLQSTLKNILYLIQNKNNQWISIYGIINDVIGNINKIQQLQNQNHDLKMQNIEFQSQVNLMNLELIDLYGRKNDERQTPLTCQAHAIFEDASFHNCCTSPRKKTLQVIIQDQPKSLTSISPKHTKQILGTVANANKIPHQQPIPKKPSISSSTPPSSVIPLPNNLSNNPSILPPITPLKSPPLDPNTKLNLLSSTHKNNIEKNSHNYFLMKTTKASHIKQPFTFKAAFAN